MYNYPHLPPEEPTSEEPTERSTGSSEQTAALPPPRGSGQFRISTLISWTTVIITMIVSTDVPGLLRDGILFVELFYGTIFACIFLFPALCCIPQLIDRFLDPADGLTFGRLGKLWLTLCVSLYSVGTLMLATNGFPPSWQGSKGSSWIYYILDQGAGMTMWPIFAAGAFLFSKGLWNPAFAKRSPMVLIGVLTNAAICFWYVGAVFFLEFTMGDNMFAIVPGSCGVCYLLYAGIVLKQREFETPIFLNLAKQISGWFIFLFASITIKIPLAIRYYDSLPTVAPESCFIVTAATKGHPQVVASWFDDTRGRTLNGQLITFWRFESRLKGSFPRFHRRLRSIYNRVGPLVARQIRFRWQADLMYFLLKPLEWIVRCF